MYTKNVLRPEIIINSVINTGSKVNDPSVLHALYVQKRLSLAQLAAYFASSKYMIKNALNTFGIPIRTPGKRLRPSQCNIAYGKKIINDKLVDNPEELLVIRKILSLHQSGLSNRNVAKKLNEQSIPTKKKTSGWNHETIRQIIKRNKSKLKEDL